VWVSQLLSRLRQIPFHSVVWLPDDVELCSRLVQRARETFFGIRGDRRAISLNLLVDASREHEPCWTNYAPRPYGNVVRTQWVDGAFYAPRAFFHSIAWNVDPVPEQRWLDSPLSGSGVWAQVSRRLHRRGFGMYRVKDSLVNHLELESQMNPEARRENPLTSVRFVGGRHHERAE
jgi:hypothetical protein